MVRVAPAAAPMAHPMTRLLLRLFVVGVDPWWVDRAKCGVDFARRVECPEQWVAVPSTKNPRVVVP